MISFPHSRSRWVTSTLCDYCATLNIEFTCLREYIYFYTTLSKSPMCLLCTRVSFIIFGHFAFPVYNFNVVTVCFFQSISVKRHNHFLFLSFRSWNWCYWRWWQWSCRCSCWWRWRFCWKWRWCYWTFWRWWKWWRWRCWLSWRWRFCWK